MYHAPRQVISIVQTLLLILAALAVTGAFIALVALFISGMTESGRDDRIGLVQALIATLAGLLSCGVSWALLAGVTAVFDIAERARTTNGLLDDLVRMQRKTDSAAEAFRR